MANFNLIDEPWIPCLMGDSEQRRELSLREALDQAPRIREIAYPNPLITVALHRLLLSILHRNFGPESAADWEDIWNGGLWDGAKLDGYFQDWHHRFDLFDDEHPFYQTGSLDFKYESSVARLAHELASGNNATLFDHTSEAVPVAFAPQRAARALVTWQAFAPPGLQSFESPQDKSAFAAPLVKGGIAMVKGETLFHTLMLNLNQFNLLDSEPFASEEDDCPAWERDGETRAETRPPRGYLDLLTWQSRRIRLRPEVEGDGRVAVRKAVVMKGYQFPKSFTRRGKEPALAFIRTLKAKPDEDPWPAIGFSEHRAIWRDSLALFQSIENKQERPKILDWLNDLALQGILDRGRSFPLDILGMASYQAKVLFWRHERLPLPLAYLSDKDLIDALGQGLRLAEECARALRTSAWSLAALMLSPESDLPGGRKPDSRLIDPVVNSLAPGRLFWSQLEVPFRRFLVRLVEDRTLGQDETTSYGATALPGWAALLRRAAATAFEQAICGLDRSPRSLKAVAKAEVSFRRSLNEVLKNYLTADSTEVTYESAQ